MSVSPWTEAYQAALSFTIFLSLLKFMSIELVMPSNHLILCRPFLLLPSIFPSIRVFSNDSALHIKWPKYWNFSFSISSSNEYSGLTSFRMDWLISLQSKELSRVFSNSTVQKHQFFSTQLHSPTLIFIHDHWKNHSLDEMELCWQSLLFNMLSRLAITFRPRRKRLLLSWLQSPSAVILEPKK